MKNSNPKDSESSNVDEKVVRDFGLEWEAYNYKDLSQADLQNAFNQYFDIFPFDKISSKSVGFDMGCGSGRWAKLIAPRVGRLNCVDPSEMALLQAKVNLEGFSNCYFECATVASSQLPDASQDFGYSLGCLHHIPDTFKGIQACANKLKSGAPFLLYLYYRFDNKPDWYRFLWKVSDCFRKILCQLPFSIKSILCQVIAIIIYLPLSRAAKICEKVGIDISNFPLSDYRDKPIYFLKTDALDRFGTKLEKRFTKEEIKKMLFDAGFKDVEFSASTPYWVAVAIKI